MREPITSPSNPLVRRARALRSRQVRGREGAFLVEGLAVVLTALERGAPIEALLWCPERLGSPAGRAAVDRAAAAGLPVAALAPSAFAALSGRDNPVGLAAIVRAETRVPEDLPQLEAGLYVALVEPADPGNVGTVLRTLDAAGASGLLLAGAGTDPFHPAAVKASLGALFTVPWAQAPDAAALLAWARGRGLTVLASSAHAAEDFRSAAYPRPLLLLMGPERAGLAPELLAAADGRLRIPMAGAVSSLNLAVATALLVYEAERWWRGPGGGTAKPATG